jgi:hypothetical protein
VNAFEILGLNPGEKLVVRLVWPLIVEKYKVFHLHEFVDKDYKIQSNGSNP